MDGLFKKFYQVRRRLTVTTYQRRIHGPIHRFKECCFSIIITRKSKKLLKILYILYQSMLPNFQYYKFQSSYFLLSNEKWKPKVVFIFKGVNRNFICIWKCFMILRSVTTLVMYQRTASAEGATIIALLWFVKMMRKIWEKYANFQTKWKLAKAWVIIHREFKVRLWNF